MFLGIEIGGTKLQLGVGHGHGGPLVELVRRDIDAHALLDVVQNLLIAGFVADQQHRLGEVERGKTGIDQIGRASCRERV